MAAPTPHIGGGLWFDLSALYMCSRLSATTSRARAACDIFGRGIRGRWVAAVPKAPSDPNDRGEEGFMLFLCSLPRLPATSREDASTTPDEGPFQLRRRFVS